MQFSHQNTANISSEEITKAATELAPYLARLKSAADDGSYGAAEACLHLPFDETLRQEVSALVAQKKSDKPQAVMMVGIGGSSLGAQAVSQAVAVNSSSVPPFFYDTVNARALGQGVEQIKKIASAGGEVLIVIISKSGATIEIIANAAVLLKALSEVDRDWQKRVIVISEPKSALSSWAKKAGATIVPHLEQVGGRFSIMSVVGLLPLAFAGVDINELRAGARDILDSCLSDDPNKNIALQSAAAIYKNLQAGRTIHDLFLFHPALENLGKWYRQLAAESLGKDGKGITPTVSIGSTDLHSMAQLYLAGPADKFTTFVELRFGGATPAEAPQGAGRRQVKAASSNDLIIPAVDETFDTITTNIAGRSTGDIIKAIYQGAIGAYKQRKLPFVEIELANLSARELGAFMQFKMVETMLLARLMKVNCFDQPAVEEYKTITRQILAK